MSLCKDSMSWRNIFSTKYLIPISGVVAILIYILYELLMYYFSKLFGYNFKRGGDLNIIFLIFGVILILYNFLPGWLFEYISKLKSFCLKINNLQAISILIVLTVIGLILRINNLGSLTFWTDEMYQTYAALGLIQQGSPVLPSGMVYMRSFLDTFLIAQSFKIFGVNEFAARLPSALFGVLTIPLVYLAGKEFGNKRVGIIAAFLITFSVFEIVWNRDARMYSQFQFLYLLTAYLFYIFIKNRAWKVIPAIIVSFILAYYSHSQIWIFVLIAFLYISYINLRNKTYIKTYALFGVLGSIIIFSLLVFVNFLIPEEVLESGGKIADITVLHYMINSFHFTLLTLITVSGMIFLISKNFGIFKKENNFYLLINFFVPLLIITIFPWRTPRYAFFIYPFLIIIVSKILDYGLIRNGFDSEINRIFNNIKYKLTDLSNIKTIFTILIISLLVSELAFNFNYENYYRYTYQGEKISQRSSQFIKNNLNIDDKVASTESLVTLYYIGRSDYLIRQSRNESDISDIYNAGLNAYSGAIVLESYNLFMLMVQQEKGWVVSARDDLNRSFIDPRVRDYIRNNMTYHPEASDKKIEVYSWGRTRSDKSFKA
ncbi:PMT family glycosyltransferase, 4-amino-4-deoxy-L-arabinose transferase [Candidatus Methanoperedens nitroreducens]|uniref:PMT family glycosyltransferase, 4-amino-4-deoxy-L-arabinose transferase n=1 Tax=Candidatus Methanoperedens nitratireducens TaxID=1392998 RepID=A0A062V958_9EURY|nr:glycosyltransferase family 39 protein [Candidatus Methanoperedens nitroreducens]KCZ72294.1 PMT family glycosyltransferase, 4-amino-4-deoxy-L-arabinose transferase [Candidatus Methanoperedens nitroreducens]MDJ1420759.1 glycosyltransferase family 39 protein [Candidatus Methanoperedens sp.]